MLKPFSEKQYTAIKIIIKRRKNKNVLHKNKLKSSKTRK